MHAFRADVPRARRLPGADPAHVPIPRPGRVPGQARVGRRGGCCFGHRRRAGLELRRQAGVPVGSPGRHLAASVPRREAERRMVRAEHLGLRALRLDAQAGRAHDEHDDVRELWDGLRRSPWHQGPPGGGDVPLEAGRVQDIGLDSHGLLQPHPARRDGRRPHEGRHQELRGDGRAFRGWQLRGARRGCVGHRLQQGLRGLGLPRGP
mmetsp:Transcript_1981/g.5865  ORF Transcript_1981/g.5865 Transcript_1981/m.5865 type:complete len:207 (-) Transcript_1981:26-646(-)